MKTLYELWIKPYGSDKYLLADMGNDMPAINIMRNNIAELKDRQNDYSQALKLPMSQNNKKIFGFVNEFTMISDLRHKMLDCVLFADSQTIIGKGGRMRFVNISDTFNVQILGPEKTFFQELQKDGKMLNDLSFTETIVRGMKGVDDSSNPNAIAFFGVADFSTDPNGAGSLLKDYLLGSSILRWYVEGQMPFVRYKSIIDKMMSDAGYTLVTDVENDVEYKNACMPFANFKSKINGRIRLKDGEIIASQSNGGGGYYVGNFDTSILDMSDNFMMKMDFGNIFAYNPIFAGTYSVKAKVTLSNADGATIALVRSDSSDIEYLQNGIELIVNDIPLSENNYIGILILSENYFEIIGLDFEVIDGIMQQNENFFNYSMPIKGNLPEIKQYDFFKTFLQIYGLTVNIDEKAKKVYAYTFNYIAARKKANAVDWSRKYQRNSGTQKFTIDGYAQKNYIRYKTEENDIDKDNNYTAISAGLARYLYETGNDIYYSDGDAAQKKKMAGTFNVAKQNYWVLSSKFKNLNFEDIGILPANDKTITAEKVLLEFDYQALEDNTSTYLNRYAKIRRYDYDKEEQKGEWNFDADNKLCLFGNTFPVVVNDVNKYLRVISSTISGGSVRAQALIDKYYPILRDRILADMRFFEDVQFYLTPQDIANYDPFTPIYISDFGAYFYINHIKNFIAGRLTKVDLVKI
ncbi:hypothetical protein FACS189434_09410 [Bacteroidia bacterium]|nr:hypothetical protein FACS189434_09410 [Bacteroidia bacterium]